MITKAVVQNVDFEGNKCLVRIPLFETASSDTEVEVTALINNPPGIFNNLYPGDIVFIGFEENALEKPIILGKLYRGANFEINARGGNGNFDHLKAFTSASVPSSTLFVYPELIAEEYLDYNTPKLLADRIKETKEWLNALAEHHELDMEKLRLYLQPWNLKIDDGDLDALSSATIETTSTRAYGIDLTADAPPTLYNVTPETIPPGVSWPLKKSPNNMINRKIEEDLKSRTKNKTIYLPPK